MKVVEQSAELIDDIDGAAILKKIERCGRVCYQSQPKDDSAENFVRMLIKRGHESVLEHESLTFRIVTSRGIMSELTRHRIASFSVESTRFVKYNELTVIKPVGLTNTGEYLWKSETEFIEKSYRLLIRNGERPEVARDVLPQCTKSELYMTANLREWRHILKLRLSKAAHPAMRELAGMIYDIIKEKIPVIVEDISK